MADVQMDVEQIADGSGVLVAVQPANWGGSGRNTSRTSLGAQSGIDPTCELLALIDVRTRGAFGRHLSIPDTGVQLTPSLSVGLKAGSCVDSLQIESASGRFTLMARLAVLLQESFGTLKGIVVTLCIKKWRRREKDPGEKPAWIERRHIWT